MMAFTLGIWWVSIPFIIKNIGGTNAHVGYSFSLHMGTYLLGCLFMGSILHHLNPKRVLQVGISSVFSINILMCLVVYFSQGHTDTFLYVWLMTATFSTIGLFMSFFWPFLVGWLSTGHESTELNQRLAYFNIATAAGGLISPFIAGYIVERSSLMVLTVSLVSLICCVTAVTIGRYHRIENPVDNNGGNIESPLKQAITQVTLLRFRWIARIGLLSSFAVLTTIRTQLGLLFRSELDLSESSFGTAIAVMSTVNFIAMTIWSRWKNWHFKIRHLIIAQLMLIAAMCLIFTAKTTPAFFPTMVLLGFSIAFLYASHLYYGIAGTSRRSTQMAIHEITLSIGVIIGSYIAGELCQNVSPYAPYWFAIIVIITGLAAQLFAWHYIGRQGNPPQIDISAMPNSLSSR